MEVMWGNSRWEKGQHLVFARHGLFTYIFSFFKTSNTKIFSDKYDIDNYQHLIHNINVQVHRMSCYNKSMVVKLIHFHNKTSNFQW